MRRRTLAALLLIAATYPAPTGWVVDEADVLSAETEAFISAQAKQLAQGSGPEMAVLTVKSIAPETIETYGIRLAEQWKVGKKGHDNGVILILALQERKVRIEVGKGAEAVLNDAKAGQILDQEVIPHFKRGDWDAGVRAGVEAIMTTIGDHS